jgi:hypothetical protein
MSLCRDRYEQVVRFSWLARQPDQTELKKYVRAYYGKMNNLMRNLPPQTRATFEQAGGKLEQWMVEKPTKDQAEYLDSWNSLDLLSMAKKRDALPPLADAELARESLAYWYQPIYVQFSSVTHYDMFSMNILELRRSPQDTLVLSPDPQWPAVLVIQNALFDLIQCFECVSAFHKKQTADDLLPLFDRWKHLANRVFSISVSQPT